MGKSSRLTLIEEYLPKTVGQVVDSALSLRRRAGIEFEHAPNLLHLLSRIGRLFPGYRLKEISDAKNKVVNAWVDPSRKILYVRAGLLNALRAGHAHAREIIAEELGHIALAHPVPVFSKTVPSSPGHRIFETEAYIFALNFLAPDYLARDVSSTTDFARLFRVTHAVTMSRMAQISIKHHQLPAPESSPTVLRTADEDEDEWPYLLMKT